MGWGYGALGIFSHYPLASYKLVGLAAGAVVCARSAAPLDTYSPNTGRPSPGLDALEGSMGARRNRPRRISAEEAGHFRLIYAERSALRVRCALDCEGSFR